MKVSETKISPQWATTIPVEIRPWIKAGPGDIIEWFIENNGETKIVVKKQ